MPARSPSETGTAELTRLGSYTIVRKLAKGGMAELFLARSTGPEGFEKLVVLKKILPRYAENPRFVQLFLDEAKLAASLDHPHIVQVYDMGRIDGNYFFTMEYVHGQDTRTLLRQATRGKHVLPIAIAIQIARTVASALHHAHERRNPDGTMRNIVHRDVSPSNILVSYDGAVKLADFGVAKAASSTVRTRTGALKGKVGYMSPEQARGMPIDRRADIFSLGVVLWELVSMRRLFKTDNDLATIQAIINTPPAPLADHRPECPPELDRIVRKALEKEPGPRYQTAQDMQRDLDELSRELKIDQSSIQIARFMGEVFAAELNAMRAAQDMGTTITDYLVSNSGDHTTPVSESELSLEDPGDGDDDDDIDEPEPDEDDLDEPTALPSRSGSIDRDNDEIEATDFGPPPTMDAGLSLRRPDSAITPLSTTRPDSAITPLSTTRPDSAITPLPKAPVVAPAAKSPAPAAKLKPSSTPTEKLPVAEDENPFDSLATRLRPNPMRHADDDSFEEQGSTTVATPAFTEEAPTVTAPPDIVKQAFADVQETVQGKKFPDEQSPFEASTSPFEQPSGFEPTAVQFEPPPGPRPEKKTTPMPSNEPRSTAIGISSQAAPAASQGLPRPGVPAAPTMLGAAPNPGRSGSVPGGPGQPPGGEPGMPGGMQPGMPGGMQPGMPGMPGGMQPGIPGGMQQGMPGQPFGRPPTSRTPPFGNPPFDPNTAAPYGGANAELDLTPQKRWLVIGGVAVGVAVLAILLVVLLAGGGQSAEEVAPDAAPAEPAPKKESKQGGAGAPAPKPAPKAPAPKPPAPKPAPKSDAGSSTSPASSITPTPAPTAASAPAPTTTGAAAATATAPPKPFRPPAKTTTKRR